MRVAIQAPLNFPVAAVSASQPPRTKEHLSARLAPSDMSSCVVTHRSAFCAEKNWRCPGTTNGLNKIPCSTLAVPYLQRLNAQTGCHTSSCLADHV